MNDAPNSLKAGLGNVDVKANGAFKVLESLPFVVSPSNHQAAIQRSQGEQKNAGICVNPQTAGEPMQQAA